MNYVSRIQVRVFIFIGKEQLCVVLGVNFSACAGKSREIAIGGT